MYWKRGTFSTEQWPNADHCPRIVEHLFCTQAIPGIVIIDRRVGGDETLIWEARPLDDKLEQML